jgi:chemotaxis response regulator CheB
MEPTGRGAPVPRRDIVVVGASSGGVQALKVLVAGLPSDFRAAVLIVLHVAPYSPGLLPEILSRAGPLRAAHPTNGASIEPGRIDVAPRSLWNAIRALDENAMLLDHLSEHCRAEEAHESAERCRRQAESARRCAEQVRQVVLVRGDSGDEEAGSALETVR